MNNDYLIVHRSILPVCYEKVINVRELISTEKLSVSEACKKEEISRSTYYKYKDYLYSPSAYYGKKIILAVRVNNDPGSLSAVLNCIAINKGNIVTISQEAPIHNYAYITITVDVLQLTVSLKELLEKINAIKCVVSVKLVAVE